MATDLASMESRVAVTLFDPANRVYSTTLIEEGLRQALATYNLRSLAAATIKNLDSASKTTLDPLHEGVLIIGACAYCARIRVLSHADALIPAIVSTLPKTLESWSKDEMILFLKTLDDIFKAGLRQAASPPYSTTKFWSLPDENTCQAAATTGESEGDDPMSDPILTASLAAIQAGESLSDPVYTAGLVLLGIQMPAAWTTADLTFQASVDLSANVADLYDHDGIEVTVSAAAGQFVSVDLSLFAGAAYIAVRSGTASTPVTQGSNRTLVLALRSV